MTPPKCKYTQCSNIDCRNTLAAKDAEIRVLRKTRDLLQFRAANFIATHESGLDDLQAYTDWAQMAIDQGALSKYSKLATTEEDTHS